MQADDETRDFGINEWMDVSSFQNSWVNYGGTSANAAYCKDSNGMVYLRGRIKNGTLDSYAFTLPVGFRPQYDLIFAVVSGAGLGRITVYSNGHVVPSSIGVNTSYPLNIPPFSVT